MSIRLTREHQEVMRDVCKSYRTSVSQVFRGYVEYLQKGGTPIGYPQSAETPSSPPEGVEERDD